MTPTRIVKEVLAAILTRTDAHSSFDGLMARLIAKTRVSYSARDWLLDTEVTSDQIVITIKPNPDSEYSKFVYQQIYNEHTKEELST